jgi:glycosyltransferase involved in cell wall biosynthesis
MTPQAKLATRGVALLATRMSVLGHDPCGGSEVVLWEDAAILNDAGIPVRVYGRAARDGAPVRVIPLHTSVPLVTSIEYGGQLLCKERDSLIVAYNEPALAGWAPERTIVRFDWSTPLPRYWSWPLWLPRFQRAHYLFPSEDERQLFLRRHGRIPAHTAAVLPNAVDLRLFCPTNRVRSNGSAKGMCIGFAGQWVPRKGVIELLEAWSFVKSTVRDAELFLAGGAQLWKGTPESGGAAACVATIRQMEENGLLHTVGEIPRRQMSEFWNSLSVAVVPSLYEPFGLVALEAMACGVPVVATAVGGLKEIVHDGESGLLVPPGDAASLARALITLLTDEPLRRRLAKGARRRAEAFSIERRSGELLQLLANRAEKAA